MLAFFETLAHLFQPRHSNAHRPKVLHPEAFAFYLVLLIWAAGVMAWLPKIAPGLPQVLGFSSAITTEQVIDQTNQARRSQGLEPLVINDLLTAAAVSKGADMLDKQYWAHISPSGKQPWEFMAEVGYYYRVAGENLARDFSNTPDMIQAWLNSPTHRANLLNNRYSEIGVAVINGKLGDYETTVVVQMFGTPKIEGSNSEILTDDITAVASQSATEVSQAVSGTSSTVDISSLKPAILASAVLPVSQLNRSQPVLSPKLIFEALSISAVILILSALICDWIWVSHLARSERLVGENLAHILYLLTIAGLIACYRNGLIF
ncbi:MAG TPA: hypothetical protein DEP87_01895 [Candidatus Pacebacteria bacterium]|nr:hypothetical protein [Candidatus Paceibacterota bacterium]